MTLRKAYVKAKDHAKARGRTRFTSCSDYGDFWGFGFMSPNYALNLPPEKAPNGGGYITVDKKTGKIGFFIPPMDLDLFRNRKPIPLEQAMRGDKQIKRERAAGERFTE